MKSDFVAAQRVQRFPDTFNEVAAHHGPASPEVSVDANADLGMKFDGGPGGMG